MTFKMYFTEKKRVFRKLFFQSLNYRRQTEKDPPKPNGEYNTKYVTNIMPNWIKPQNEKEIYTEGRRDGKKNSQKQEDK